MYHDRLVRPSIPEVIRDNPDYRTAWHLPLKYVKVGGSMCTGPANNSLKNKTWKADAPIMMTQKEYITDQKQESETNQVGFGKVLQVFICHGTESSSIWGKRIGRAFNVILCFWLARSHGHKTNPSACLECRWHILTLIPWMKFTNSVFLTFCCFSSCVHSLVCLKTATPVLVLRPYSPIWQVWW